MSGQYGGEGRARLVEVHEIGNTVFRHPTTDFLWILARSLSRCVPWIFEPLNTPCLGELTELVRY